MISNAQGLALALVGFVAGVMIARRMFSWHVAQCCRCSSQIIRAIARAHYAILDLRRSPCLCLEHARHIHHDDQPPPGPPAGSHP